MNQGKLDMDKQEKIRVNIDVLRIREVKWTGMGSFNWDDHYIYCCGQESHRRNGLARMVNKRVWNAVLGCNLKNDRMILVHFQGKAFNITVIQVYALTTVEIVDPGDGKSSHHLARVVAVSFLWQSTSWRRFSTCNVWISIARIFLHEWFSLLRYAAGLGNSKMKEEKLYFF